MELPHPPTKTEEDVPLAVWPQSLGEDVPCIDDNVDEAVDGVLHWDRAMSPETLSSMEVERSSSMVSGISTSTGQSVRSLTVLKRSSPVGPGRSSPVQMDKRSPTELKSSSPTGPERTSPKGLQRTSPKGPDRRSSIAADIITSMAGPGSSISAAPGSSTQAETGPQQRVPTGKAHGRPAPGPCRAGRCLREGWRRLKACGRRRCRPQRTDAAGCVLQSGVISADCSLSYTSSSEGPISGVPGGRCGSASPACAGDSECRGRTRAGAMGHSKVPTLDDLIMLLMMHTLLFVKDNVWPRVRQAKVGDCCTALQGSMAWGGVGWRWVAWGAAAWARELLSSHPAPGCPAAFLEAPGTSDERGESLATEPER